MKKKKYSVFLISILFTLLLMVCSHNIIKATFSISKATNDSNMPYFSIESGFYDEPFELRIIAEKGDEIYYTIDGSMPDRNSEKYTGPILLENASSNENVWAERTDVFIWGDYEAPDYKIDKANVIRAVSYKGNEKSNVATAVYFIGLNAEKYENLPVVSIVTDPANLFDYEKGIYVLGKTAEDNPEGAEEGDVLFYRANYKERGEEWERPACFQYFSADRSEVYEQAIGIRIRGANSRHYAQKSFNLYAGMMYDNKECFDFDRYSQETTLCLSSGGNDRTLKMKDAVSAMLTKNLGISVTDYQPCLLFLNGEYWGLYYLTEHIDSEYLGTKYGIQEDNVVLIKTKDRTMEGEDALGEELYDELIDFLEKTDMSSDDAYEELDQRVDIQNLINYYTVELYLHNKDWPHNNVAMWRTKRKGDGEYEDTKWRWILFDTNYYSCMGTYSAPKNSFETLLREDIWLLKLLQNQKFKEQFITSFMDICNTTFERNHVAEVIDKMALEIAAPMREEYQRFPDSSVEKEFNEYVSEMKDFFHYRYEYISLYAGQETKMTQGIGQIVLLLDDETEGSVKINSVFPDLSMGSWIGNYYRDVPICLSAIAKEGYKFSHWETTTKAYCNNSSSNLEIVIPPEGIVIKPIFERAMQDK